MANPWDNDPVVSTVEQTPQPVAPAANPWDSDPVVEEAPETQPAPAPTTLAETMALNKPGEQLPLNAPPVDQEFGGRVTEEYRRSGEPQGAMGKVGPIAAGATVGTGTTLANTARSAAAALRGLFRSDVEEIDMPKYDKENPEHKKIVDTAKRAMEIDAEIAKATEWVRDTKKDPKARKVALESGKLAKAQDDIASLKKERNSLANANDALKFYRRNAEYIEGKLPKEAMTETERKIRAWLGREGSDKLMRVAKDIDQSIPQEYKDQVAEETKKGLAMSRLAKDPAGWMTTALTQTAMQIPIMAEQIVTSTVGNVVMPGLGGFVAGTASMIGLETGGFIDTANQMEEGLSEEQKKQWRKIVDKYAFSYGTAAGVVEYMGNLFGTVGALKGVAEPVKKSIIKRVLERAVGVLGEGAEEWTQSELENFFMSKAIADMKGIDKTFAPQWTPQNSAEAFRTGAVVSALTGGPAEISGIARSMAAESAQNEQQAAVDKQVAAQNEAVRAATQQRSLRAATAPTGQEQGSGGTQTGQQPTPAPAASQEGQGQGQQPDQQEQETVNNQVVRDPTPEEVAEVDALVTNKQTGQRGTRAIDALYGIETRTGFVEDVDKARRTGDGKLAIGFVDTVNQKGLNDKFGHTVADQILTDLNKVEDEALKKAAEQAGISFQRYRTGGDERGIIAPGATAGQLADALAPVRQAVDEFMTTAKYKGLDGNTYTLSEMTHARNIGLKTGAGAVIFGTADDTDVDPASNTPLTDLLELAEERGSVQAKARHWEKARQQAIDNSQQFVYSNRDDAFEDLAGVVGKTLREHPEWDNLPVAEARAKAIEAIRKDANYEFDPEGTGEGQSGGQKPSGIPGKQRGQAATEEGAAEGQQPGPQAGTRATAQTRDAQLQRLDTLINQYRSGEIDDDQLQTAVRGLAEDLRNSDEADLAEYAASLTEGEGVTDPWTPDVRKKTAGQIARKIDTVLREHARDLDELRELRRSYVKGETLDKAVTNKIQQIVDQLNSFASDAADTRTQAEASQDTENAVGSPIPEDYMDAYGATPDGVRTFIADELGGFEGYTNEMRRQGLERGRESRRTMRESVEKKYKFSRNKDKTYTVTVDDKEIGQIRKGAHGWTFGNGAQEYSNREKAAGALEKSVGKKKTAREPVVGPEVEAALKRYMDLGGSFEEFDYATRDMGKEDTIQWLTNESLEIERISAEPEQKQTMADVEESDDAVADLDELKKNAPKPVRKRGLSNNLGALGGEQQRTIQKQYDDTENKREPVKRKAMSKAVTYQDMLDQQDRDLRDSKRITLDNIIDETMSKVVDVGARWKRRVLRNADGRQVVMYHDLMRGASGEALRQYEIAEKKIYQYVKSNEEKMFNGFLQARRTIEVEALMKRRRGWEEAKARGKEGGEQAVQESTLPKAPAIKNPYGLTGEHAAAWMNEIAMQYPEVYDRLKKAADIWDGIMTEQINALYDSGLIDAKTRDAILRDHKHYTPRQFVQHFDRQTDSVDMRGKVVQVTESGLRKLDKGSEKALVNNSRLLLANVIARTQTRVYRNRANNALHQFVVQNPSNDLDARLVANENEPIKTGRYRIFSMQNGSRQSIDVPIEIAASWVNSDPQMSESLAKVLNVVLGGAILKPMATGINPGFAIGNMFRDIAHSWFSENEYSPIIPIAAVQLARDFAAVAGDVIGRKGIVTDYIKDGGSMEFLTTQGALYNTKPWETVGPHSEAMRDFHKWLSWAGETSELWTRMALKRRALRNGRSGVESSWIARRYLDFALGGSAVKTADKAIPYLNAATQGTRGVFRAFKTNPYVATFKACEIILAAGALAYWNKKKNKEAWDAISDREKSRKFIFTTPFSYIDKNGEKQYIYIGIPKDQFQAAFATMGELLFEMADGGKPNMQRLWMSASELLPVDASSLFPPTLSAFAAYVYNKDFWKNEDIWKGREGVTPKNEFWNTTPEPWVLWGKATGMSPERSRRAFHTVIPENLYTWAIGSTIDAVIGGFSDEQKAEVSKPFIEKLTDYPVLRRIVRRTWPRGKRDDDLIERANKVMVDTHNEKGDPLQRHELMRQVEIAERVHEDKAIQTDRKFDLLAVRASLSDKEAQAEFVSELGKLKEDNYDEYRRVRSRIKDRYKDVIGGTWYVKELIGSDELKWGQKAELLKLWEKMSPEQQLEFSAKERDRVRTIDTSLREYRGNFAKRREKLRDDKGDGEVTPSEFKYKMKLIDDEEAKFKREVLNL